MWSRIFQLKKNGFTILEVMIAIFIVTIGVLAAYNVTQQIISYTHRSAFQLTAIYLGKEGIEVVRNIRDTNWLEEETWNTGLGVGEWEADYTAQALTDSYDGDFLYLEDGNNFYKYISLPGSNDVKTNFTRKITITPLGDSLGVSVEVWWNYKGNTYGPVTAQENLYGWYPE